MNQADLGTLGARLRYARALSGLTSRELGRLAGVSEGYPSCVETGARANVSVDALRGFAGVLGLSLDWLVDGTGSPPTARETILAAEAARKDWAAKHPETKGAA